MVLDLQNFEYTANNFEVLDIEARYDMNKKFGFTDRSGAVTLEKPTHCAVLYALLCQNGPN